MISLLKAWYGESATKENDYCFDCVPRLTGDHSQLPMTLAMVDGVMKGQFMMGQNPVVGGANSDLIERGLTKLEWLVVRDFAMTETADFWQKGRLVQRGELRPQDIGTEIFFMPAAMAAEKEGTLTNTSRLVQWHDKVCDPPGDSRSETWFVYHLGRRLKALYAIQHRTARSSDSVTDLGLPGQRTVSRTGRRIRSARDQWPARRRRRSC